MLRSSPTPQWTVSLKIKSPISGIDLGHQSVSPPGEWEVAMTDMSYTAGLNYIRKGDVLFTRNPNSIRPENIISVGDATTVNEFTEVLSNSLLNSSFEIINATSTYTIGHTLCLKK